MKILIIGYGLTGKALNDYLNNSEDEVFIYDDNIKGDNFYDYERLLKELPLFDLGIKSPGIRKNNEKYRLLEILCKNIVSELDFSLSKLKNENIILITGSNGKTTLTRLLQKLISIKYKSYVCGNIGVPLITLVNKVNADDYLLIEISSFQLEDLKSGTFKYGIITSLHPNHLNEYDSYIHYLSSKKRMLMFCKNVIAINENPFNINKYISKNKITPSIIGKYNDIYLNFAYEFASSLNIEHDRLIKEINDFKLDKFRLEFLGEINNFKIINDSKSTSSSASKYAYETYNKDNIILILGGIHKSDSFSKINMKKGDLLLIFGKDKTLINEELNGLTFDDLEEVIKYIVTLKKHYTIIFSPGCSSYDQYKNYIERGNHFNHLVSKYIGEYNE